MQKTFFYILFIAVFIFVMPGKSQVYEIYKGDTINQVDKHMRKQGSWIYFFDDARTQIRMEGRFLDNKRVGLWVKYYKNGNRKNEITYKNGKPIGPARFYYENGHIREEGEWLIKHWIGEYRYYHDNGNLSYEFYYNAEGKRTGEQNYFYKTGDLMITGKWENGKEKGVVKEYYKDGTVKNEKIFNEGKYQKGKSKTYEKGEKPGGEIVKKKSKKLMFTGNYRKTSPEGYLLQRGYFEKGELVKGKWHFYDINGKKYMTKILENKKVVKVIDYTKEKPAAE